MEPCTRPVNTLQAHVEACASEVLYMVDRVARHGVNYPPAHPSTAHLVATPCEHHLYALMMYVAGEWTQFGNADTKLGDEIARAQYLIRDGWVA